jgi:hypothetical protein
VTKRRKKPAVDKPRPKLPTPDERMLPYIKAIFTRPPGAVPKEISEPLHAALDASHAGIDRHRNRNAGIDWQSVYAMATAADRDVFSGKIESERVRAVLATLQQTGEVTLARGRYYPAFIKWVRRGLKSKKLEAPRPLDM